MDWSIFGWGGIASDAMSEKIPNAVVIGYGYAGRRFHSYLIGLTPGLRLHGVASRDPAVRQQIVAERKCRAYESFEQVIADAEVDLVVLATPHDTHARLAVAAMNAGKHVVTDKVMCLRMAEADEMIETSRRKGVVLSVFHNRRLDGDFLTLKQVLAEGTLGEVRWIEMAWQRWGPPRNWRAKRASGGGRLYDLGAHMIDQLLQLFPEPVESVYCRMHHDFDPASGVDVESQATVTIGFAGGRTGIADASSFAALHKPRFYALGSAATFMKHGVDPQEAALASESIDSAREDEYEYALVHDGKSARVVPTLPGRWRSYYENVAEAITRGEPLLVKPEEVRRVVGVLEAAVRSGETGEVVRFDRPL